MITIIRGEDRTLTLPFTKAVDGTPFSFSGVTAIEARLANEDGTTLSLTLAAGAIVVNSPSTAGVIAVTISDAQTALLRRGLKVPLEIVVDFGTNRRIFDLAGCLAVADRLLP